MDREFSVDDLDDFDDVTDDMIAESRVVEIIDEMEFVEDDLDFFDESEFQRELTEMF
ncbi:MAG: hypothetical protein H6936_16185 [Burkholderiales bacterium]|nr:hypothetical protein [Nitrosomonas sp.]MCP5276351.1 hypothetical protein [Burkholderiales bacterium]